MRRTSRRPRRRSSRNAMRATHMRGGTFWSVEEQLAAAGLTRDAERLRKLHARMHAAYEAGRLAQGDRLADQADVLTEKIDTKLDALDEEGSYQEEPIAQSVTRQFADVWGECHQPFPGNNCPEEVREYRRLGHGPWVEPTVRFVGPKSAEAQWLSRAGDPVLPEQHPRYPGEVHKSGGMIIRSAYNRAMEEHPEWFEVRHGYHEVPGTVYQLREILGDHKLDGIMLLDAAEDAWQAMQDVRRRIRAGAERRRTTKTDPLKEARKFVRRTTRRKKRTSRR